MSIGKTRGFLYRLVKLLLDVQVVKSEKVGKRIARRAAGKATGRAMRKIFKSIYTQTRPEIINMAGIFGFIDRGSALFNDVPSGRGDSEPPFFC